MQVRGQSREQRQLKEERKQWMNHGEIPQGVLGLSWVSSAGILEGKWEKDGFSRSKKVHWTFFNGEWSFSHLFSACN